MALPRTREAFKNFCLQNLGQGATTVNVTPQQVENRIDMAIEYFHEFAAEGSERIYHFHTITEDDVTNRYIEVPDNVITINAIVPSGLNNITGGAGGGDPMFTFGYQFRQREMMNTGSITLAYFYMMQMYRQEMINLFRITPRVEFSRLTNRIDIYAEWGVQDGYREGDLIVIDGFGYLSGDEYPRLYSSLPLIELATAMIKLQIGENLGKYGNVELPGGIILNGEAMYERAKAEIAEIKDEIQNKYSAPPIFYFG